jgi:hypothetical protein
MSFAILTILRSRFTTFPSLVRRGDCAEGADGVACSKFRVADRYRCSLSAPYQSVLFVFEQSTPAMLRRRQGPELSKMFVDFHEERVVIDRAYRHHSDTLFKSISNCRLEFLQFKIRNAETCDLRSAIHKISQLVLLDFCRVKGIDLPCAEEVRYGHSLHGKRPAQLQ